MIKYARPLDVAEAEANNVRDLAEKPLSETRWDKARIEAEIKVDEAEKTGDKKELAHCRLRFAFTEIQCEIGSKSKDKTKDKTKLVAASDLAEKLRVQSEEEPRTPEHNENMKELAGNLYKAAGELGIGALLEGDLDDL